MSVEAARCIYILEYALEAQQRINFKDTNRSVKEATEIGYTLKA
jgi:hypothetical protein